MNARHFEIFLTVMTSRSLAEAADRLLVSQPAVSKSLRLMEQELGVRLFLRVKGRLQPTAEASQLVPHVQRAISQLQTAARVAEGLRDGAVGQVVLAAAPPAMAALVPPAVSQFRRERPDIQIGIKAQATREVLTAISTYEADIGLAPAPVHDLDFRIEQLCESRQVSSYEVVVAFPKGHALGARSFVRPTDLRGVPVIALPDETPTSVLVGAAFRQAGVPLRVVAVASHAYAVCGLVQEGIGIGLISPLLLSQGVFPRIEMRPLRPRVTVDVRIYLSRFQPLSVPAQHLVDIIENIAGVGPKRRRH